MKKDKFYITTPIYYVNDKPHVGHAYTTIIADTLARYHRFNGRDVYFVTGTDENSQKNVEAAEKRGEKDIKKYLDEMSAVWAGAWDSLGITNDDFIRTTEKRHLVGVEKFFKTVWDKGDIYLGAYEGYYCAGCEAFVPESDLAQGKCPIHQKEPKKIKEKNYFFRLTKYRDALLDYIGKNEDFVEPVSRRNEILNYIRDFMEDISISRESQKWGIPLPSLALSRSSEAFREGEAKAGRAEIKNQVLYVWFDALLNYLTAIGYGTDEKKFKKYWPADLHLVGKDIIKFHCALWPAMLMSAGLPLPKKIFAHGFFTIDGLKISKSLGNILDPIEFAQKYGGDVLRYFLLREITLGEDGDFSVLRLKERYQSELANGLGNLMNRVLAMTEKYFNGKVPEKCEGNISPTWLSYDINMSEVKPHAALKDVWDLVDYLNKFIDSEQPWVLAKIDQGRLARVIYTLLESLRHIGLLLLPFMPETAEKILDSLGVSAAAKKLSAEKLKLWGLLKEGGIIKKAGQLFPRLD
ncbi:MAG: methionine--tRNA ligase [Candidatus Magasanikbacteria bacterium]|nr:methionine--tRNA ligase [Candidatus Magasanikbacteria bacterium]